MANPAGRAPIDDSEAVQWIRDMRAMNPRVSYRQHARRFLKEHPDYLAEKSPDSGEDSVARRIADKARDADGVLKRSDTTLRLLHETERSLSLALHRIRMLIEQERNQR